MADHDAPPDSSASVTPSPGAALASEPRTSVTRVVWVDQAKGMAIVLVVLYHAAFFMDASGWGWLPLTRANGALATARMPLFFFASGLFFSRQLAKPVRSVLTRRVLPMLWLYCVWSVVFAAFFTVVPWIRDPDRVPLADLPWILVKPSTELWFLYALALYFVLTWVLNRILPMWAQFLVAVSIAVGAIVVDLPVWAFEDMARHYIVFLAAVHLAPMAFGVAAGRTGVLGLVAVLGWGLLLMARERVQPSIAAVVDLPLALFAVAAGVALCAQLRGSLAGRFLRYVGGRTLSVYVLHVLVLGALFAFLPAPEVVPWWLSLMVALGATLMTVVSTAWLYPILGKIPGLLRAPWIPATTGSPRKLSPASSQEMR